MKQLQKYYYKGLMLLITLFFIPTVTLAHFGSKGLYGGSVSCAIMNDTTAYLGTFTGGVYESITSKLTNWRARPVGLKSGKITALAHNGKYLFAATADSGIFILNGYVGTDRYWQKANTGLTNLRIKSLVAIDSVTLIAGTDGSGLFKTTSKGAGWVAINNSLLNTAVITGLVKAGNRIILTALNGGVFASDDKGDTWQSFNDVHTLNIAGTKAISYNTTTDEILVVNNNGIFKAVSASSTGRPVYTPGQEGIPANTVIRSVSSNTANWYLATDKGVFATSCSTINWISQNAGLSTMDITIVAPFQASIIAGTNKEGIFQSPAGTVSWLASNTGFNNLVTYSMATMGVGVIAAATEKGVFVSTDLAATYKRANKGLSDSLNVTDLAFSGTKLYASTKTAGVFLSADTGKTWTPFNSSLMATDIKKVIAIHNNLFVLTSAGEVYQYTVNAWKLLNNGLPNGINPTSLAYAGKTLVLSTQGNGVYTKAASAGTWVASNTGLSNLNTTSLTAFGSKIFAGTDGAGVFVSDTAAVSWAPVTTPAIPHTGLMGLNGTQIQAMASYGNFVFASYKGGLLATADNGATWIAGGNQFNLPSYSSVSKIAFVTTRVFVTTENNCLYSNAFSELPAGINTPVLNTAGNFKISPNPSDGHVDLVLADLQGEIKQMLVYDHCGRLVQSINKGAWQSITKINIHSPAGVYYIKIYTDKGMAVQKAIIK